MIEFRLNFRLIIWWIDVSFWVEVVDGPVSVKLKWKTMEVGCCWTMAKGVEN